jgi:hypothetical protein
MVMIDAIGTLLPIVGALFYAAGDRQQRADGSVSLGSGLALPALPRPTIWAWAACCSVWRYRRRISPSA